MPKYQFRDGTPYDGPIITLPDGRILSGLTYTTESKRLVEIKDGGESSRELHQTSVKEKIVQPSKGRSKGRKKRPVVSKKSAKTSPAL